MIPRLIDHRPRVRDPQAGDGEGQLFYSRAEHLRKHGDRRPETPTLPTVCVSAERRATHSAGRKTIPRGTSDKSRNASGSV
jgi:hypothetical protein